MTKPDYQRVLEDMDDYIGCVILCEGLPSPPIAFSPLLGADMDAEIAKSRLMHHPDLCALLDDIEQKPDQAPHDLFQDLARKPITLAFTEEAASEIVPAPYSVIAAQFGLLTVPAPQFISYRGSRGTLCISAPQDGTAITWGVPLAKLSGIRAATPIQQQTLTRMHTGRTLNATTAQDGTLLHLKGNGLILSGAPLESFTAPIQEAVRRHRISLPNSFFSA